VYAGKGISCPVPRGQRYIYHPEKSFSIMRKCRITITAFLVTLTIFISGCTSPATPGALTPSVSGTLSPDQVQTPVSPMGLDLNVGTLTPGSALPDSSTCKGAGESPAISWNGIPSGTKSLVLILEDPDVPTGTFTHWIVFNIPPQKGSLAPAQPNTKVLANGAQQGDTSAGSRGYYPPCPPIGTTHRYIFRLYALDMDVTMPTADRSSINWAMDGHTISKTEFTTTFMR
jgi:Raf kinase inhibitor-like YbhB/YbcL family protein